MCFLLPFLCYKRQRNQETFMFPITANRKKQYIRIWMAIHCIKRSVKPNRFIVDKNCFLCFLGAQLQLPTREEQLKLILWPSIKICKNYTKSLNFGTHPCNCIKSILFGTCTSNQDFVYTSKAKLTFNGR
jgi:hypothetical protein